MNPFSCLDCQVFVISPLLAIPPALLGIAVGVFLLRFGDRTQRPAAAAALGIGCAVLVCAGAEWLLR